MAEKLARRMIHHRGEGSGLFEQMMSARHDDQFVLTGEMHHRRTVELDHRQIAAADDQ